MLGRDFVFQEIPTNLIKHYQGEVFSTCGFAQIKPLPHKKKRSFPSVKIQWKWKAVLLRFAEFFITDQRPIPKESDTRSKTPNRVPIPKTIFVFRITPFIEISTIFFSIPVIEHQISEASYIGRKRFQHSSYMSTFYLHYNFP